MGFVLKQKHHSKMQPAKTKRRRETEKKGRMPVFPRSSVRAASFWSREKPRGAVASRVPPVACPVTASRWPSLPGPAECQVSTVPVGESRICTKHLRGRKGR